MAAYVRIGHHKTVDAFRAHLKDQNIDLPCDDEIRKALDSPLAQTAEYGGFKIGNRFCIHPMEGWTQNQMAAHQSTPRDAGTILV